MFEAISFGSATVDVFMDTEAKERAGNLEYPVGTKILVNKLDFQTGGCGMNVAIGLRRLGIKSSFLGKIGSDENGKFLLNELKKENVPYIGPKPAGKTGYSIVLDSVKHNRTILHYRGAGNELYEKEIKKSSLNSEWLYSGSALGESFKTQKMMMDIVKKNNIKLAYNPGITECSGGRKGIEKMLLASTLLILNLEEAKALTKEKIVTSIMKKLLNYGPKIVCITDGPNEITCSDGTWLYALRPNKTRIVERTGAGDAFSSGLLAGLIRNKDIEFSMQLGLANSESVIQYFGSRNKLLSWKEAALTIRKRRGRIRKMKL